MKLENFLIKYEVIKIDCSEFIHAFLDKPLWIQIAWALWWISLFYLLAKAFGIEKFLKNKPFGQAIRHFHESDLTKPHKDFLYNFIPKHKTVYQPLRELAKKQTSNKLDAYIYLGLLLINLFISYPWRDNFLSLMRAAYSLIFMFFAIWFAFRRDYKSFLREQKPALKKSRWVVKFYFFFNSFFFLLLRYLANWIWQWFSKFFK